MPFFALAGVPANSAGNHLQICTLRIHRFMDELHLTKSQIHHTIAV